MINNLKRISHNLPECPGDGFLLLAEIARHGIGIFDAVAKEGTVIELHPHLEDVQVIGLGASAIIEQDIPAIDIDLREATIQVRLDSSTASVLRVSLSNPPLWQEFALTDSGVVGKASVCVARYLALATWASLPWWTPKRLTLWRRSRHLLRKAKSGSV